MLGSVPPLRDCVVIRKSCHSGRAMECIARSGIQENEIISKRSRFLRKPESSIFKDFLDSPVKPGNDAGGGLRIRHPGLDPGSERRIRSLFEGLIVSVIKIFVNCPSTSLRMVRRSNHFVPRFSNFDIPI